MKPPLANAGGGFLRLECWEGAPRLVGCRVVCATPTASRVMAFRPVLLDRYGRQSAPGGRRKNRRCQSRITPSSGKSAQACTGELANRRSRDNVRAHFASPLFRFPVLRQPLRLRNLGERHQLGHPVAVFDY